MSNSLTLIIANATLYWITFIAYQIYKKRFDIGSLILLLYSIAFSTAIYFSQNTHLDFSKYALLPALYLYFVILLCIFPVLKSKQNYKVKIDTSDNEKFLNITSSIIIVISILILPHTILLFLKNVLQSTMSQIANSYSEDHIKTLPDIIRIFVRFIFYFKYIIPFLLLHHLRISKSKNNKIMALGLGVALFELILYSIINAERVNLVVFTLYLFVCFFLYKQYLKKTIQKVIKRTSFIILTVISIGLITITVARFKDVEMGGASNPMLVSLSLYMGEGSLRFNTQMWNVNVHSAGDNTINVFKKLLNEKTFIDYLEQADYWDMKQNIQNNVFYTYVGDIFSDYGAIGTFLICFMLFVFLNKSLPKRKTVYMENLILSALIINIYIFGFTFYQYKTYYSQLSILISLIFCLVLIINRKFKIKIL